MLKPALFVDRDGVLNREIGDYVVHPDFLEPLPHAPQLLHFFKNRGFLIIVITNQGGIAKGLYTHDILKNNHEKLRDYLQKNGAAWDDLFYCPHHPTRGHCLCRKPGSLMIERAIALHKIDPAQSLMIGDSERDIVAANAAGVRGYQIKANEPTDAEKIYRQFFS